VRKTKHRLRPTSLSQCREGRSDLLISSRWFALIRIWSPWLAPRQGKSVFGLDKEAVTCAFLSNTGKHIVLLAISGVNDVMTTFKNDEGGIVLLRVRVSFLLMI
jgi:hypothetical protein